MTSLSFAVGLARLLGYYKDMRRYHVKEENPENLTIIGTKIELKALHDEDHFKRQPESFER